MSSITPTKPSPKRGILPREGLVADVVQSLIQKTVLNPALTLPLLLYTRYSEKGRGFALDHPTAIRRLKLLLYLGAARWVNGVLNQGALNNWQRDKYEWAREIVVITGASNGFGKLLVHHFAEKNKNTRIINLDIQSPSYSMPSKNVHYMKVDLVDPEAISAACKDIKEKYGDPTVLILNAGVAIPRTIVNMPDALLQKVFAVNTLSHYRLAREFVPHMASRNHGMIVTLASVASYATPAGAVDYAASKSAALSFHEGLTTELIHRLNAPKVRTIVVTPGFASTELTKDFINPDKFLSPTQYPETVADAIFEKIMSESSGNVSIPKIHSWLGQTARAWPWWMQKGLQAGLKDHLINFAALKGQ